VEAANKKIEENKMTLEFIQEGFLSLNPVVTTTKASKYNVEGFYDLAANRTGRLSYISE